MSQIYFIVENKTPEKILVFVRGAIPNVHNNTGPYEEVDANSRKQLSHSQDRGAWFALSRGYVAYCRIWLNTPGPRKSQQDWSDYYPASIDGKAKGKDIEMTSMEKAPGGDINVVLTFTNLRSSEHRIDMDVRVGIR